ncbi:tetratricopeptide repeat protein [candidate division KSB1 bacterium]|nr:tetratricopeptide repeat protein [candidate division KSB1 bacterium]
MFALFDKSRGFRIHSYPPLVIILIFFIFFSGYPKRSLAEEGRIPITTHSDTARSAFLQGQKFLEEFRFDKAAERFLYALELDSTFLRAHLALIRQRDLTQGGSSIELYLLRAQRDRGAASLGEQLLLDETIAWLQGDLCKQESLLEKLTEAYPAELSVAVRRADFLIDRHDYYPAAKLAGWVVQNYPDHAPGYRALAAAYMGMGYHENAEKTLRSLVALVPHHAPSHLMLGAVHLKLSQFPESRQSYQKALQLDPDAYEARLGLAANDLFSGNREQAFSFLKADFSDSGNPAQNIRALHALSLAWIYSGEIDSALALLAQRYRYQQDLQDQYGQYETLMWIGDLNLYTNDLNKAAAAYMEATRQIDSSDLAQRIKYKTQQNLTVKGVYLALAQDQPEKAQAFADRYFHYGDDNVDPLEMQIYHELAGRIAFYRQDWSAAIREWHQSDLQNPHLICDLAQAYQQAGQTETAYSLWTLAATFNELSLSAALAFRKAHKMLADLGYRVSGP